jgi:hypothetical protein
MKNSSWQDVCTCGCQRTGHSTLGQGSCHICGALRCPAFVLLRTAPEAVESNHKPVEVDVCPVVGPTPVTLTPRVALKLPTQRVVLKI